MRRLTNERQAHGWSRAELARRTYCMNAATVGQIESGYIGRPYPGQLAALATALGVADPESLLEEVEDDRP